MMIIVKILMVILIIKITRIYLKHARHVGIIISALARAITKEAARVFKLKSK